MSTDLVRLDAFTQALVEAKTIPDVKSLLDQADLFRQWLKKQRVGRQAQNTGAEMCLKAMRRLGEMLEPNIQHQGGRPQKQSHDVIVSRQTLKQLNIEPMQSHRWQKLAEIPVEDFEEFLQVFHETEDEMTTIALVRFWSKKTITPLLEEYPLPEGQFRVIACDPPWQYGTTLNWDSRRVSAPYPEMSVEQLMGLEIPAADDSLLWLWTTNAFLHDAYHLLEAWGFFQPKTILTWFKERIGVGYWLRGETEHCVLAVRGQPKINHKAQSTHLKVKATNHSRKPDEFYELVESLCGTASEETHLEMFARKPREGWRVWGYEAR